MYKKVFILACVLFLASCKGTKYTSNTKKPASKPRTTVVKKPVSTQPKTTQSKPRTSDRQTETLEATSTTTVYVDVIKTYIDQYKEIAKDNMRTHGIPASITLAQGILESGSGNGRLAKEANNHFGIKCHTGWTGNSIKHDDDALQECFRKYRHASESFRNHSLFLSSRARYNDLFKLNKDDYQGWAKGLRKAGYATDPKYPDKLISLIQRYELYQYDNEVLGNSKTKTIQQETSNEVTKPNTNVSNSNDTAVLAHKVAEGDTLYSISNKYNTTIAELKRLNNLSDNTISIGQVLRVK